MSRDWISNRLARLRRRRFGIDAVHVLPWLLAVGVLIARVDAAVWVWVLFAVLGLILLGVALQRARRIDARALLREAEGAAPQLEDSADLLLRDPATLGDLARLQRERIRARLAAIELPSLQARLPWRRAWPGLIVAAVLVFMPWPASIKTTSPSEPAASNASPTDTRIRLLETQLQATAPAYTGLGEQQGSALDLKAVTGSELRWQLRFDPQPRHARLRFHDGRQLELEQREGAWQGHWTLDSGLLYRIEVEPEAAFDTDALHRIDAFDDAAPRIHFIQPEASLSQHEPGQRTWALELAAEDDFGLGAVELIATLAQGSGEQVTVIERRWMLEPEAGGDARARRYRRSIDLASLGFAAGDDLIVKARVRDNHPGTANVGESLSRILRWPPPAFGLAEGVDGIVQNVLPAYFRSQRQIIIDTEALIEQRPTLEDAAFMARSDSIGVDQKILRLRYGQFLGEEFESGRGAEAAHESSEDEDHNHDNDHEERATPTQADALRGGHAHGGPAAFGSAGDVLREYGHAHDVAEAATLLDPRTKKILKSALDEMWQAELHLRQGEPNAALPYERRALSFIKEVQQSTRIYLARVGLELPPVDLARRHSGDRAGLRDTRGHLAPAQARAEALRAAYLALGTDADVDLAPLEAWIDAHGPAPNERLGLLAALDRVRRDPNCAECRNALRDALWPWLPMPAAQTSQRVKADALGADYLRRLEAEPRP